MNDINNQCKCDNCPVNFNRPYCAASCPRNYTINKTSASIDKLNLNK